MFKMKTVVRFFLVLLFFICLCVHSMESDSSADGLLLFDEEVAKFPKIETVSIINPLIEKGKMKWSDGCFSFFYFSVHTFFIFFYKLGRNSIPQQASSLYMFFRNMLRKVILVICKKVDLQSSYLLIILILGVRTNDCGHSSHI